MISYYLTGTTFIVLQVQGNASDVLNNSLGLLILNELDSMAATVIFKYMQSKWNKVTSDDEFMILNSSKEIDSKASWTFLIGTSLSLPYFFGVKIFVAQNVINFSASPYMFHIVVTLQLFLGYFIISTIFSCLYIRKLRINNH